MIYEKLIERTKLPDKVEVEVWVVGDEPVVDLICDNLIISN